MEMENGQWSKRSSSMDPITPAGAAGYLLISLTASFSLVARVAKLTPFEPYAYTRFCQSHWRAGTAYEIRRPSQLEPMEELDGRLEGNYSYSVTAFAKEVLGVL